MPEAAERRMMNEAGKMMAAAARDRAIKERAGTGTVGRVFPATDPAPLPDRMVCAPETNRIPATGRTACAAPRMMREAVALMMPAMPE